MRYTSAFLAFVTSIGLLFGSCAPAVSPARPASAPQAAALASQPPSPLTPVRGGLLPSILSAPLYAGVDLGIYRQNGLDVTVEPFTVTSDIMTMLAGGHLEFGFATMGSAALNAFNRGTDLVITGAGALAVLYLLIRKDLWDSGAIRSTRDLSGAPDTGGNDHVRVRASLPQGALQR